MKKLGLLLGVVLVGVVVAFTYFYFEYAVHHSISYVWTTWFNSNTTRWLVVPLCVVISLIFFGTQHLLDPASENHESHGLGEAPKPTIANFATLLFVGFFSLLAGASLGPEAILVPACMIAGGYIGSKLFSDARLTKLLSMAGFIALFTAFFHSFIAGMLGLLLVKKQTKLQLKPVIILVAAIASATTYYVLKIIDASAYLRLPENSWNFNLKHILGLAILVGAGYGAIFVLGRLHNAFSIVHDRFKGQNWVVKSLVASLGLSTLYLLGGNLVEFTGNESIVPMLSRAASLGFIGLAWIMVVKLAAIGWSKTLGYRGGMIFPTIFVASVLVAILQLYMKDINFIFGLVAVLIGAFAADKKVKILI
ncbi:MAG TPA: hypothetical protein VLE69_02170 [Candidatus Saccharimonadales bacterium]|nr:hypothetical protein [Candidatus Saccharimonadales bacterium]